MAIRHLLIVVIIGLLSPYFAFAQSNYTLTNDFQYGVFNSYVLSVDSTGNNLQLTFVPVPEPGTIFGVGVAGFGLLAGFRRFRA